MSLPEMVDAGMVTLYWQNVVIIGSSAGADDGGNLGPSTSWCRGHCSGKNDKPGRKLLTETDGVTIYQSLSGI